MLSWTIIFRYYYVSQIMYVLKKYNINIVMKRERETLKTIQESSMMIIKRWENARDKCNSMDKVVA